MAGKNCVIVYGCPSKHGDSYDVTWMDWLKKELETKNMAVELSPLQTPWEAKLYETYKAKFDKCDIGENTTLIGHSCGAAFLIRWLGETKRKIHKLILVAPWKLAGENQFKKEWYVYEIDNQIKNRVDKIIMFTSDNEKYRGKQSLKIFHKALDGEIIELKGRGHYTLEDMGTEEIPELLKVVLD